MSDPVWDGITNLSVLSDWAADARTQLANSAKRYDWPAVLAIVREHGDFINSSRPDGRSWFAPLHQAAHGGAPDDVIRALIAAGAWRGLRSASGERPVDVARRRGHTHLLVLLEPPRRADIATAALQAIQDRFHGVILGRVRELVEEHQLRLPELEVLVEMDRPAVWFPVPGMYGGFSFRLEGRGPDSHLVSDSWIRVVGGSEERHVITAREVTMERLKVGGFKLVEKHDSDS